MDGQGERIMNRLMITLKIAIFLLASSALAIGLYADARSVSMGVLLGLALTLPALIAAVVVSKRSGQ